MRIIKLTDQQYKLLNGLTVGNNTLKPYYTTAGFWGLPENVVPLMPDYFANSEIVESSFDFEKTEIEKQKAGVKFRVTELAYSGASFKDHKAIEYTSEVKNLHAKRTIDKGGFLTNVVWYEEPEFFNEVLKVEVVYETDLNEPIPAAQSVIKRTVTRKWKSTNTEDIHITDINGNVIQSVTFENGYPTDPEFWKVTEKHYKTSAEKRAEGIRRRGNIITQLGDGLGYHLMTGGDTLQQAEEKIAGLMVRHATALSVYRESGKGSVYIDVQADTTEWMTQELKDYTVAKLRGEV